MSTVEQWQTDRKGMFTASEIWKLFTQPQTKAAREAGELSETAKTYIKTKVAEELTGFRDEFTNKYVEWGNEYERHIAGIVKEKYPDHIWASNDFIKLTERSGGSPDGFIPSMNIVTEFKCPYNPENHVEYCMMRNLKEERKDYWYQLQFNMLAVSKEKHIDFMNMRGLFISYHPLFQSPFPQYKEIVILPDSEFEVELYSKLIKATEYFNKIIEMLKV